MKNYTNQDIKFKYEHFFEMSPDLLCIAGYDGYFKKINAAVSNLLEYSMEELYARPIDSFIYEDDKHRTIEVRNQLIRRTPLHNFENRYVTKSGRIVWLSWTSQPIEEEQLVFAIAKNITYKKRLEAERIKMIEELNHYNNELKQINYTTSHNLRSPVNNLMAIFNLLDDKKIEDPETLQLMDILKLAGENLKETLDGYVDILGKKQANVVLEEVNLPATLDKVINSILGLVHTSRTNFHILFSVKNVLFNKAYLESIFLNLITNSIKYARPGHPPKITIGSAIVNNKVQLTFQDNGLGFDLAAVKDRIFGIHQKFHNHSDSKGVGLYLVHSHVTSLQGKIKVESKVNEGTKFIIEFNS